METKTDSVSMGGLAMDDKTVADFMLRLEGCGLFSAVSLRNIKQVEMQKTALKSFEIVCTRQWVQTAENKSSAPIGAKK
jgi:type IV pilus assembly protein PilN